MSSNIFSSRTVVALIITGILSFTGIILISVFAPDQAVRRDFRTSTYSVSAVGHKGLAETFRAIGRTVIVSRTSSAAKAGNMNLLIAAEPRDRELLRDFLKTVGRDQQTLYVLPKRSPYLHSENPLWISEASLAPASQIDEIADMFLDGLTVYRTGKTAALTGIFGRNTPRPDVDDLQLLHESAGMFPVLRIGDGVLLAKIGNRFSNHYILSDPDILNNQGLLRGRNAELTYRIIQTAGPEDAAIIFDETIHGFGQSPDLWRNILTPPLLAATLTALTALILLVLAGIKRFGPPLRRQREYNMDRAALYDVTATLLEQRGDTRLLGREYAAMTIRKVAASLHLPSGLSDEQKIQRLAVIARRRGVTGDIHQMLDHLGFTGNGKAASKSETRLWAGKLNHWSHEVMHGTR
tara:strand:+ start:17046 stop:18272 length:1227 start_codon:yes stop_codon:yes gene_type:complete